MPASRPSRESVEKLAGKVLGCGVVALPVAPGGEGPGTQRRHGAAWSPSDVPTPLPYVVLVGSRHPINPGSRDLNSLWPSPVTGSKTNSSSCKLSITGKAGGGGPGLARRAALRAPATPPPGGRGGRRPPAAGRLGLRLLFPLPERAALTLCVLRSPSSQSPPCRGSGSCTFVRARPRVAETSPLARSREVWSWYCQAPGGGQPPSLPGGCWIMGYSGCPASEVALRGPRVLVSKEAV